MITQLTAEKVENVVEIKLLRDDSNLPAVYHVLVIENGEQKQCLETLSEKTAYGMLDGFKNYYNSQLNQKQKES